MCSSEAFVHKSRIIQPKEIKSLVGELSSYKSLDTMYKCYQLDDYAKPICKDLQFSKGFTKFAAIGSYIITLSSGMLFMFAGE